jgi:MoxR-like ATPase
MEKKLTRITSRKEADATIDGLKPVTEKINLLRNELRSGLVGRSREADIITLALASGRNGVLIGDPGTAKSAMTLKIPELVEGNTFTLQLHKGTEDFEILGRFDPKELRDGRYVRITKGTILEAGVAVLDEVFEGSSILLNALRAALEERVYYDGGVPYKINLHSVLGTSNIVPEDSNLAAFYDRFLFKGFVESIGSQGMAFQVMKAAEENVWSPKRRQVIGMSELVHFKDSVALLKEWVMPLTTPEGEKSDLARQYLDILGQVANNGVTISDRSIASAQAAVATGALIAGKSRADEYDLQVLEYILPHDKEDARIVASVLRQHLNPDRMLPSEVVQLGNTLNMAISNMEANVSNVSSEEDISLIRDGIKALKRMGNLRGDESARTAAREYAKIEERLKNNEAVTKLISNAED